jgi:hypothetical protein
MNHWMTSPYSWLLTMSVDSSSTGFDLKEFEITDLTDLTDLTPSCQSLLFSGRLETASPLETWKRVPTNHCMPVEPF